MHHFSSRAIESFFRNQLNELYLSMALRSFAFSLVGIFVPIYLLTKGYSLQSVFWFLCLFHAIHACCAFFAARLAMRIGFSLAALLSIPCFICFYLLLYTIDAYHWPLWLLVIPSGVGNPLFWMAYHIDFLSCSVSDRRGEEVSSMKIVSSAATALAPAVGAFFITATSFNVLLVIVMVIFLLSAVPLFFSRVQTYTGTISFSSLFSGQKIRDAFAFLVHGFDQGIGDLWPLFLFVVIEQTYKFIGVATSVSLVASFVTIFFIGRLSNHHARTALRTGALGTSLLWIARILWVKTPFAVYSTNAFGGILGNMVTIPFTVVVYEKTEARRQCQPLIAFESLFHLGHTVLFALMALVVNFWGAFFFGALIPLLYFIHF